MKQIPLAIGPPPQPSFDNFIPGANAAAVAHLRMGVPCPPFSPAGRPAVSPAVSPPCTCGASPAAARPICCVPWRPAVQLHGQRAGWFDAADPLPWTLAPDWTLLVIDRCEALQPDAQHAAFTLFVDAATHGVQVAAAGRLPPVDLPLRDDVRTRLAWGHVFALQPLADAEASAALRREAGRRGMLLPDEVIGHLLTRVDRDLGHLMRLLDRLDPRRPVGRAGASRCPLAAPNAGRPTGRRPEGRAVNLALFDLDGTLIPKDSDHAFGEFVITLGWADALEFRRRNYGFYNDYQAGTLDINAYVDFATAPWRQRPVPELQRALDRFVALVVRPMVTPAAIELVDKHRRAGDLLAVVTATNDFVTRPIGRLFGIDELIATQLTRDASGNITGTISACRPSVKARSRACSSGWRNAACRWTAVPAAPSTATPSTTCRCWSASSSPWPPTPARH